jgi:D-xylose transport system permease protein
VTEKSHGPRIDWRALTMVGALLVIWVVFSVMTEGTFLTSRNLSLLARQMSVTSILAVGMVLVIVAGQIDLSVGALAGFLGAVAAIVYTSYGWPLAAAFVLALVLGAVLGLMQGALVAYLNIPPFIVTLGGMLLFQGALLGVTGGVSITPSRAFLFVGQSYVPKAIGYGLAALVAVVLLYLAARSQGAARWRYAFFAVLSFVFTAVMNNYEGVPLPVMLVLALASLLTVVALHTPFGRHLYAIGGNRDAAFYSGISIARHIVGVFAVMGLLCGVAGIVLTARVGSASADAGRMMRPRSSAARRSWAARAPSGARSWAAWSWPAWTTA